jgi:MFS family permease
VTESDPDRATPSIETPIDGVHATVKGGLALWTLFVGFAMLMIGNGLNLAVIGVRIVDEGFGVRTAGIVMAGYFAGFLLGPAVVVRLLSAVGHIRVFASLASLASCAVLVHFVWVDPVTWTAMRFVFGFCMAGLYVVVESWLNDASTPSNRGRTLAVYMIVSMGGLAVGQLLIATADPANGVLFVVASILVSLSFVPMALAATADAPPVRIADPLGLRDLARTVPTGLVGMLFTGASHGILFGLAAVYATRSGFSPTRTAIFVAAPAAGALVLQWPIGWASDRVPRRGVIVLVAAAAAGIAALLALAPGDSAVVVPLMLLLGGCTFPLYSLLLTYTLDWSPPGTAMAASGTLLRVNGTGAVVGPIVGGVLIGWSGESAMFWSLVVTHGIIVAYLVYRLVVADGLPLDRQGPFVPMPARATDFALRLTSRPLKASRSKLRPTSSHRDLSGSDPSGVISGRRW